MNTLFTYKRENGLGEKISVVLAYIDGGRRLDMIDFLVNSTNITEVIHDGFRLYVDVVDGVPVVAATEDTPTRECDGIVTFFTRIYENNKNLSEAVDAFFPVLSGFPLTKEELHFIGDTVITRIVPYFDGRFKIKVAVLPATYGRDRQAITEAVNAMNLNNGGSVAEYGGRVLNVTVKQENPEDLFYIKIPEYERIKSDLNLVTELVPNMDEVFVPFPHPLYYSPYWRYCVNKSHVDRKNYIRSLMSSTNLGIGPEDVDTFVDMPVTEVLGDPLNDELPIQDNEVDFYNSLVGLIKYDLEKTYSPEVAEELFKNGGITSSLRDYFEDLVEEILMQNWSCSGMFPIPQTDSSSSDDSSDDAELKFEYYNDTNPTAMNGLEYAIGWIRGMAEGKFDENAGPLSSAVYAEAVVKLARWGIRKPRCLKLTGSGLSFNLEKFTQMVESTDFSKLTVQQINGRDLALSGIITSHVKVQDTVMRDTFGDRLSCPVGFVALKFFEGDKSQIVYISATDVVREYMAGNAFIDGIDLQKDGHFSVDEGRCDMLTDSLIGVLSAGMYNPERQFYCNENISKMGQLVNLKEKSICDLAVLGVACGNDRLTEIWSNNVRFSDMEELRRVHSDMRMEVKTILTINMGFRMLPIYLQVNSVWDTGMGKLLDTFYSVMEAKNYRHSLDFFSEFKQTAPVAKPKNNVSDLDIFNEKKEDSMMIDISPLIQELGEKPVVKKIVKQNSGTLEVIGYLSSLPSEHFKSGIHVVIGLDEVPEGSQISETACAATSLEKMVWRTLSNITMNNLDKNQVRFISKDTPAKIFSKL